MELSQTGNPRQLSLALVHSSFFSFLSHVAIAHELIVLLLIRFLCPFYAIILANMIFWVAVADWPHP